MPFRKPVRIWAILKKDTCSPFYPSSTFVYLENFYMRQEFRHLQLEASLQRKDKNGGHFPPTKVIDLWIKDWMGKRAPPTTEWVGLLYFIKHHIFWHGESSNLHFLHPGNQVSYKPSPIPPKKGSFFFTLVLLWSRHHIRKKHSTRTFLTDAEGKYITITGRSLGRQGKYSAGSVVECFHLVHKQDAERE